jgi:hypothetical protein
MTSPYSVTSPHDDPLGYRRAFQQALAQPDLDPLGCRHALPARYAAIRLGLRELLC